MRNATAITITVALLTALGAGCAPSAGTTAACGDATPPPNQATILVLTDGTSAALDRFAARLAEQPEAVFGSPDLALDARAGTVVVVRYGTAGEAAGPVLTFDLTGHGNGAHKEANAAADAQCLHDTLSAGESSSGLAAGGGGNLIRAISDRVPETRAGTTGPLAIVAAGFGRSATDGLVVATADLGTPAARQHVIDQLAGHGLLPHLGEDTSLYFLDPAEGITNGIAANGIEAFASDLCGAVGARHCSVGMTPGVAP
jgi:hypothetical protein